MLSLIGSSNSVFDILEIGSSPGLLSSMLIYPLVILAERFTYGWFPFRLIYSQNKGPGAVTENENVEMSDEIHFHFTNCIEDNFIGLERIMVLPQHQWKQH